MKLKLLLGTATSLTIACTLVACGGAALQRVPPGQSIRKHLEGGGFTSTAGSPSQPLPPLPSPTGVDLPTAATGQPSGIPMPENPRPTGRARLIGAMPNEALPPLPVTGLPERNDSIEKASEAYNRGTVLMRNGQNREAIAAFEETTQLDPSFTDAWTQLTFLYEKIGDKEKTREAFRRAKGLSAQPERLSRPVVPTVEQPHPAPSLPPSAPQPLPPPTPVN